MKKIVDHSHNLFNFFFHKTTKNRMSRATYGQLLKHYFVGGLGAALNYILFNTFMLVTMFNILVANSLSYAVVLITQFFLQKHFTYRVKHHSILQPLLFIGLTICHYILDTFFLILLINVLHIVPAISKMITIATLAPLSFLFQKYIVFKVK